MARPIRFLIFVLFLTTPLNAATVKGTIVDPDGRPVSHARIVVTGAMPGAIERHTAEDGAFDVTDLPEGRYQLRVMVDGFTADAESIDVAAAEVRELRVQLRVSAMSESLIVSAAQVDLPISEAAASVTVLTGADLQSRQIRSLTEALRTVPGLALAQNGGFGTLASLFPRGGESDFTLVLVDGMRANSFGGGLDLSQVPLIDVERIEIVRGPQSAVFGSDAIGGVIQIVSRRSNRDRVSALVEGGSFNSLRGQVAGAGSRRGWSWHVQAEHAQSDGFDGIAPATGERVSNNDARIRHAGGGLAWRSAGGAEVHGVTHVSFTERGFPGPYGSNPIGAYTAVDRISRGENNRRQFGLQWLQPWFGSGSRVRQRTEIALVDLDSNFVSRFGFLSESETRRASFRTQTDVALTTNIGFSAGLEIQRERAGSTFIMGASFEPIPVRRTLAGYFGEVRYHSGPRWSAAAGVRVEQIRRDSLAADPNAFQPRPAFDDESLVSPNPRISAAYLLRGADGGNTTRLRASAGTGIRPPDAFEIAFTDNPSLQPERSRSFDAGIQQTLARGAVLVDATGFFNDYDDLIVAVGRSFRDASRYRTDNISNARSRGLELAAAFRPAPPLDVRVSYTRLATEILSIDRASGQAPVPYRVGESLIRRPRNLGSVTVLYANQRVTGFVDATMRGKVRDVEPTFGASGGVFDAGGFTSIDLGAAYRFGRVLELFGRIENAGGDRYEEAFGFPSPGRSLTAGVRVAAGR